MYRYRDLLVELPSEEELVGAIPDITAMLRSGEKYIITAPGRDVDFVSRFFAPAAGVPEDPVTGSAHAQLIPFWSRKSGKRKMLAKQLSKRKGTLHCEYKGDRVLIGGQCVFYMKGRLEI